MSQTLPNRLGASITVTDTTALALLDPNGLDIGTNVYVADDTEFWTLVTSTAALGPGVVEVLGTVGARWVPVTSTSGFVTFADLSDTTLDNAGANLIGVYANGGQFSEPTLQGVLQEDVVIKTDLAATDGSGGAALVGIQDTGGYYTGTNVELALQEIGAKDAGEVTLAQLAATTIPSGASLSGVNDAGSYYTGTTLETVTQEIGASLALKAVSSVLASTSSGQGASLVGVNDTGGLLTATNVETALQEIAANITAGWPSSELQYAQSLLGKTLTSYIVGAGVDTVAGAINSSTIVYDSTGATISSTASANTQGQGNYRLANGLFIPGPGNGGKLYVSFGAKIVTAPSGTTTIRIQVTDTIVNSVHFEINSAGATPSTWRIVGTRGGGAFDTAGTGAAAALDVGVDHRFSMIMDGTTITFQIDHVTIGTGPQSAASLLSSQPAIIYFNGAGGGAKAMSISQWFVAWPGLPSP